MNYLDAVRKKLAKSRPEEKPEPQYAVITVRMSRPLKRDLDLLSGDERTSLNKLCVAALQHLVDERRSEIDSFKTTSVGETAHV